jgi:glycerol-1-phosphate dehydrogenase [NAD(P)+]
MRSQLKSLIIGAGTVEKLTDELNKLNAKRVFILSHKNAYAVCGKRVEALLKKSAIPYTKYVFEEDLLEPDEKATGKAFLKFDEKCDTVLAIGSGVINDISKILSTKTNTNYVIIATAPSMDGYASVLSSMVIDGLKVSIPSRCADVIIGDTDILKTAPDEMLRAGIGDMLAKYISIAEWRIANLLVNEDFNEEIAERVRQALKKCVQNASGLLKREDRAIEAVFSGLVLAGEAMCLAGTSRPASGCEHYFSHIWDMRGIEFNIPVKLHGIQVAYGTYLTHKLYMQLKSTVPIIEKALDYVNSFNKEQWFAALRSFLNKGAEAMIALEEKEGKYDKAKHRERLEKIIAVWQEILDIINEEIPDDLDEIYSICSLPRTAAEAGVTDDIIKLSLMATKDIRDKYVLSRLLWDIGILEEIEI